MIRQGLRARERPSSTAPRRRAQREALGQAATPPESMRIAAATARSAVALRIVEGGGSRREMERSSASLMPVPSAVRERLPNFLQPLAEAVEEEQAARRARGCVRLVQAPRDRGDPVRSPRIRENAVEVLIERARETRGRNRSCGHGCRRHRRCDSGPRSVRPPDLRAACRQSSSHAAIQTHHDRGPTSTMVIESSKRW